MCLGIIFIQQNYIQCVIQFSKFFGFFLCSLLMSHNRTPVVALWVKSQLGSMRTQVQSLALLSGLRIWPCHELQCRLQMWLRSGIAVAVVQAGSCGSDSAPVLGTYICCRYGPKKQNKTKNTYHIAFLCHWVKNSELLKLTQKNFQYLHVFLLMITLIGY